MRMVRLITGLYWLAAFTATHLPTNRVPKTNVGDKIQHFVAYLFLGALLYASLWMLKRSSVQIAILCLVILLTYGALDELTQPLVGRTCSIRDWYADAAGAATAILVMTIAHTFRHKPAQI